MGVGVGVGVGVAVGTTVTSTSAKTPQSVEYFTPSPQACTLIL